jgi:hypothetical protein
MRTKNKVYRFGVIVAKGNKIQVRDGGNLERNYLRKRSGRTIICHKV